MTEVRFPNCSADGVRADPGPVVDPTDCRELWVVDGVLRGTPAGLCAELLRASGSSPLSSEPSTRTRARDLNNRSPTNGKVLVESLVQTIKVQPLYGEKVGGRGLVMTLTFRARSTWTGNANFHLTTERLIKVYAMKKNDGQAHLQLPPHPVDSRQERCDDVSRLFHLTLGQLTGSVPPNRCRAEPTNSNNCTGRSANYLQNCITLPFTDHANGDDPS